MSETPPGSGPAAGPRPGSRTGPRRGQVHRARRRLSRWPVLVVLTFVVAGVLFVTSSLDSRAGTLRTSSVTDLATLVRDQRSETDALARRAADLNEQVSAMSRGVDTRQVKQLQSRIDEVRGPAGLEPAYGQGLTVSLSDASQDTVRQAIIDGTPTPATLVVHQQDIQAVVNALWLGGAKAMTLMGRRVVSTTGIRCVGSTVILQGVPYSPAVRDPGGG